MLNFTLPTPVVGGDEFPFAAAYLDHGHIGSMTSGLQSAGAKLKYVYDRDRKKAEAFAEKYGAKAVSDFAEILCDDTIRLVAAAAVPSERCEIGLSVMDAGKDYFTDKAPFTTLEQLEAAKKKAGETGRKYAVYYSERLCSECSIYAGELIKTGAIGRVVNIIGTGPHRIGTSPRPDWFYQKEKYGGILCDIGSHQAEQFLYYTGSKSAVVSNSAIGNFNHPMTPELDDFGEMNLISDNGATGYHRVDWFTPDGLKTWGDGRCTIIGTDGFIELRKYTDLAQNGRGDNLYFVNHEGEYYINARGKTGFSFFGELIRDCIDRTEISMTAEHAFLAAELCLIAQRDARVLTIK